MIVTGLLQIVMVDINSSHAINEKRNQIWVHCEKNFVIWNYEFYEYNHEKKYLYSGYSITSQ